MLKHSLIFSLLLFSVLCSSQSSNPLVIGKTRFTVITPELIRLEYSTDGNFIDNKTLFANNRLALFSDFTVTQDGKSYIISTKRMEIHFIDDGRQFSQKNIYITVFNGPNNYKWDVTSKDKKNLGGTVSTLDEVSGPISTGNGLLSRNGWQLIDDSGSEIFVNDWIAERPLTHLCDFYFFAYGHDYKAALKALTSISGVAPMNRKYVHGSWYCRWWNYTSEEFLNIVKEYETHDFPLDVMVMDMGWHTRNEATTGLGHAEMYGWTGYTWDKKLIPDPDGFLKKLKDNHLAVTLNDHPHDGIRHHEEQYPNFMKAMGTDTIHQKELPFDAGNKTYMDNFFKYAHTPNEKKGVDFWWLDWQQDYVMPHVTGFRNLKHLPWLNYLYFQHSEQAGKRGLSFSRWAGWGSQRTPIQFSGDAVSTWEMLKFQVPFTATSGNVACFFWAHDIGGFSGKRNVEQYVRWTQFGLTTSSLRIHSVISSELDRRPRLWGLQAEAAMKRIYHLRSQLMPYIYSSVWQVHNQSIPLNRAMYIEYPDKEEAYNNPQEFLFGDLLLSAPIVSPGTGDNLVSSQKVWFPEGDIWYNIFNNKKYQGGTTENVSADINEFPLFVKGGFPLPMQPYKQRMATAVLDTLIIRCYPGQLGAKNSYTLYEDDGISNEYLQGKTAFTNIHYQQKENGAEITIDAVQGAGYKDQPIKRTYLLELPTVKVKSAVVNGKKVKPMFNDKWQMDYILVSQLPINKTVVVRTNQ